MLQDMKDDARCGGETVCERVGGSDKVKMDKSVNHNNKANNNDNATKHKGIHGEEARGRPTASGMV